MLEEERETVSKRLIQLSADNWAELRDPRDISERLRRPIVRAITRVSREGWLAIQAPPEQGPDGNPLPPRLPAEDLEAFGEANDAGIVALVKAWSYPAPVSIDAVLDLPAADYDRLRAAVAPLIGEMFTSFEPSQDPDSPIAPSSDSATRSEGGSQTDSQMSGEPIASSNSV